MALASAAVPNSAAIAAAPQLALNGKTPTERLLELRISTALCARKTLTVTL